MNRDDVLPLLRSNKAREIEPRVLNELRQMDETELFFGLYSIAVTGLSTQGKRALPTCDAADLLLMLNPYCALSCQEAIKAMLTEWEVSLQEVPFYLHKQFGLDAIEDAIETLRSNALTSTEKKMMDAVRYWARIAENEASSP